VTSGACGAGSRAAPNDTYVIGNDVLSITVWEGPTLSVTSWFVRWHDLHSSGGDVQARLTPFICDQITAKLKKYVQDPMSRGRHANHSSLST